MRSHREKIIEREREKERKKRERERKKSALNAT